MSSSDMSPEVTGPLGPVATLEICEEREGRARVSEARKMGKKTNRGGGNGRVPRTIIRSGPRMSPSQERVPSERPTPGMISTDRDSADRRDARRPAGKGPGSAPAREPRPGAKAAEIRRIPDSRPAPTRRQVALIIRGTEAGKGRGVATHRQIALGGAHRRAGGERLGREGMWVGERSVDAERGEPG